MKVGLLLMKNILTILAESVLVPSELMLVASAIDAPIQKKIFEFGTTAWISSNEDFKKLWFLGMLMSTIGASLLGNMSA